MAVVVFPQAPFRVTNVTGPTLVSSNCATAPWLPETVFHLYRCCGVSSSSSTQNLEGNGYGSHDFWSRSPWSSNQNGITVSNPEKQYNMQWIISHTRIKSKILRQWQISSFPKGLIEIQIKWSQPQIGGRDNLTVCFSSTEKGKKFQHSATFFMSTWLLRGFQNYGKRNFSQWLFEIRCTISKNNHDFFCNPFKK